MRLQTKLSNWIRSLPGATDPDDVRLDTLNTLLPFVYILAGISVTWTVRLSGIQLVAGITAPIFLFVGAIGAQRLRSLNFRISWHWLMISGVIAIGFLSFAFPDSLARYLYPVVITMTTLVAFRWSVLLIGGISVFVNVLAALALETGWTDMDLLIDPLLVILLTSGVVWLTSYYLHQEFRRSRASRIQVRDMLEQLRVQRAELTRTIQAVELANNRIERMNVELVEARNIAENADRIKSEFLAHMSHELRTPLNAILNFTAFVADGLMGDVNEEQIDTLQKVMDSGNHLLILINDILDISKIEAGMMNLFVEEVDLNVTLKGTFSTAKGLIKDTPVELVAEIDDNLPPILGDKRRIRQIFLNLVSNAVKFTPEGQIVIQAHQKNGEIHIAVKDSGIGIAPEDRPLVFQAFRQAQHDLRNITGTGLGLPICKHFVEAHGGKLWLESEVGVGSTFFITLPIENTKIMESTISAV
jgi:signal transduction histidine kinase